LFAEIANIRVEGTPIANLLIAMNANRGAEETEFVDQAVAWLRDRLPSSWTVDRSQRFDAGVQGPEARTLDAAIDLRASNGTITTLAVEARRSFAPRDVEQLLPGLARVLRTLAGNIPVLLVAPWLSPRTQELLDAEGINFLDLTGNARIRLENPALYVRSAGAARNPQPTPRGRARVRGPKAARLVRLLADARPPYGVREVAGAARLAPGYVSRLLDALDREALIERSRRGRVESVDVAGLLRRWAESYDVFKANDAATYLAPEGASEALRRLRDATGTGRVAVTGSFAAVRFAPVAAPALLLAYCDDVTSTVDALGLLPASEGGNVALLRPFDAVVWDRATDGEGVSYVAPSQTVADCLTGTGRMPAEGEALLKWMNENESRWRRDSLAELIKVGSSA
jgi:hypothetical protein